MNKTVSPKKTLMVLFPLFLLFFIFNYLTPMAFGDDYVYSFVWEGHTMYEPMSEQVMRVSSFRDLFISQWSHYLTGNGRAVSHTIAQFFLWMGKDIFNVFNALISVLLIMEIYWISHKGRITFSFNLSTLCFIAFVLWAFTPGFSPVFFWLCGACNYLWTTVFLLGFLLPYIRKYYFFETKLAESKWFSFLMLFFGIVAGWSNENSICWIILVLSVFIFYNKGRRELESWMFAGLFGLIIGYALLMLAPGNVVRLHAEINTAKGWINAELIKGKFMMLYMVVFFQFLLWYFCLRSIFILQNKIGSNDNLKAELLLVKIMCILSVCMSAIMLFSPNFPPRSSFPGTVQLVIATCLLLRIQEEYEIEIIKIKARRFLCFVSVAYTVMSVSATLYGFCNYHFQMNNLLVYVKKADCRQESILSVPALIQVDETINNASGLHLLFFEMSEKENDWRNVAFSRYYGLKGLRMIKQNSAEDKEDTNK